MPHISAKLSAEARRGLDRYCTSHGVTLSALIEAVGLQLNEGQSVSFDEAVERAKIIDHERRSR